MAGSSLADAHFFGIWSSYATIDPSILEPALGTPVEFKAMVATAHDLGIRIFLDVTTHGVVDGSPLITAHPDWFEGGKWSMTDFKYASPDFLTFWKKTWTDFVLDYGVDGYRLDGPNGISYHSDVMAVWDDIIKACRRGDNGDGGDNDTGNKANRPRAGKEIVVFGEVERYHFSEHDHNALSYDKLNSALSLGSDFGKPVMNSSACYEAGAGALGPGTGGQYETIMFSCHDSGWVSKPGNKLSIRGSRASLGYQGIFSWRIPLFFSGDEFNNEPIGLPALSEGLYSGGSCCAPGQKTTGGWSYGTQIDLETAEASTSKNTTRTAMFSDVQRMLQIGRAEVGTSLPSSLPPPLPSSLPPWTSLH
jgi:glycosidase